MVRSGGTSSTHHQLTMHLVHQLTRPEPRKDSLQISTPPPAPAPGAAGLVVIPPYRSQANRRHPRFLEIDPVPEQTTSLPGDSQF